MHIYIYIKCCESNQRQGDIPKNKCIYICFLVHANYRFILVNKQILIAHYARVYNRRRQSEMRDRHCIATAQLSRGFECSTYVQ